MDNMEYANEKTRIKTSQPVSLIIPVFNCENYLAEAIESVLSQTYQAYELLVIDDGSTDRSREIALSYPRVKYIRQENLGAAAARNHGIRHSQGNFLAFLDADDLWLPEKLSLQIAAFDADPTLDIVTGHVEQFITPGLDEQTSKKYSYTNRPMVGYSTSAMMIKRTTLNKTGLFHEDYREGETISWFAYIMEKDLKILILPEVVTKRRIHGENLSLLDKIHKNNTLIRILKKFIDHKRTTRLHMDDT